MITYTTKLNETSNYSLDKNKKNILIIGKAKSVSKNRMILNPLKEETAKSLYGDCDLYNAYCLARSITNDSNIYTANCQLTTDFIELIDDLVYYNFDYIVPLDVYFRDTFVNPVTDKRTYLSSYYLERLGMTENNTTLVMTDYKSDLYNSIDEYLADMKKAHDDYMENDIDIISQYGSNLVFTLNNFIDNKFPHVALAASLSVHGFNAYPKNVAFETLYDIDYRDLKPYTSISFYKYHPMQGESSIEQLNNFRVKDDIYKRVLIDLLVKHVVSKLDLSEFNGSLFNPYVKVKIDNKVKKILKDMNGKVYTEYRINGITFNKTGIGVGHIVVDISITPYSLLENINILMRV